MAVSSQSNERAVVDLAPDLLIPGVAAAQLALVEEDRNAGSAKCLADLLSSLPVLRGVTEKYRVCWLSHGGPSLTEALLGNMQRVFKPGGGSQRDGRWPAIQAGETEAYGLGEGLVLGIVPLTV
jgi:hypothetical protein